MDSFLTFYVFMVIVLGTVKLFEILYFIFHFVRFCRIARKPENIIDLTLDLIDENIEEGKRLHEANVKMLEDIKKIPNKHWVSPLRKRKKIP